MSDRELGTVKWFKDSKGYGFIKRDTELFAAHGEVIEIRVVTDPYTGRPRGFAFVDMATEEAARTAIAELNGQTVDDRQLRVAEARPRKRRDPSRDLYTSYRGW